MKLVLPPKDLFEESSAEVKKASEIRLKEVERSELTKDGHLVWYKGLKYPKRLSVHPMAGIKTAIVKRGLIDWIRAFLFPTPKRILDKFAHFADSAFTMYSDIGIEILASGYIKPENMCRSGREIYRVLDTMLDDKRILKSICMIWEFDNAYRYRFQDFFGIVSKEKVLKTPRKEILRVLDVMSKRENEDISEKYRVLRRLASFLLFFPYPRKFVKFFFAEANLKEIQLDVWDLYYCFMRPDYNFLGLSWEVRQELWKREQNGEEVLKDL